MLARAAEGVESTHRGPSSYERRLTADRRIDDQGGRRDDLEDGPRTTFDVENVGISTLYGGEPGAVRIDVLAESAGAALKGKRVSDRAQDRKYM